MEADCLTFTIFCTCFGLRFGFLDGLDPVIANRSSSISLLESAIDNFMGFFFFSAGFFLGAFCDELPSCNCGSCTAPASPFRMGFLGRRFHFFSAWSSTFSSSTLPSSGLGSSPPAFSSAALSEAAGCFPLQRMIIFKEEFGCFSAGRDSSVELQPIFRSWWISVEQSLSILEVNGLGLRIDRGGLGGSIVRLRFCEDTSGLQCWEGPAGVQGNGRAALQCWVRLAGLWCREDPASKWGKRPIEGDPEEASEGGKLPNEGDPEEASEGGKPPIDGDPEEDSEVGKRPIEADTKAKTLGIAEIWRKREHRKTEWKWKLKWEWGDEDEIWLTLILEWEREVTLHPLTWPFTPETNILLYARWRDQKIKFSGKNKQKRILFFFVFIFYF